jgi:NMD protein affecting ribosome stability and mRNA decay
MEVKSGISKTSPKSILEKSRLVAKKEKLSNALVSSVTPNETQVMELSSGRVFDIVGSGRFKEGDDVFLLLYHGRVFILKGV